MAPGTVSNVQAAAKDVVTSVSAARKSPAVSAATAASAAAGLGSAPILCDVCASRAKFVCSGCKNVSYCSQTCQVDKTVVSIATRRLFAL